LREIHTEPYFNQSIVDHIMDMTHEEMAWEWRFSVIGNILFNRDEPYYDIFYKRFMEFGGMTPEMSKKIGARVIKILVATYCRDI